MRKILTRLSYIFIEIKGKMRMKLLCAYACALGFPFHPAFSSTRNSFFS